MPNISSIPEVLYQPNQPYHYHYDNLPLKNILTRIGLVNIQVDTNSDILRGASGSAGSLNNRLDVSLKDNGKLKSEAVDESLHNIGYHSDGMGPDNVEYVRMTQEERNKLILVDSNANNLSLEIEDAFPTVGNFVELETGVVRLMNSSTIFFDFQSPNIVKLHSIFPPDTAHRHHYDRTPAYDNPSSPSYRHFKTTAINTSFEEDSLRVYVNGVKLTTSVGIKVPTSSTSSSSTSDISWVSTYIETQSHTSGTFSLNRALSTSDVIRIDFDEIFVPPPTPTPMPTRTATPMPTPTRTATPTPTPTPTTT